ncbi:hypothetical protein [Clostridium sp. B9]|uniref:hypothetical protein n=1 Tax=Clostridium sp. B9 TaxID=3423224 RepID=UPI003D2EBB1B
MPSRYSKHKIVLTLDKSFSSMEALKYAVITRLQNEGYNCKDTNENIGLYPLLKINAKNFMLTLKNASEQAINFENCNEVILVPHR